ncbi:hypothetical protein GCM10025867_01690 [Frondihabitans sucicola]|uniref:Uncharacterized protein n=1 Tax=Frondihabitans sucicola TaxID=1268041 RepID=A0ABN6XUX1_9MICO|nr:hypothetical protein GCM10025867_01690 [Frondihabitans sucicola]
MSCDSQLLHGARADDRGRDAGVVDDERDGHVDERHPVRFGEEGEFFDDVELALVRGASHVEPGGRAGLRGRAPRASFRHFPVSHAPESGL